MRWLLLATLLFTGCLLPPAGGSVSKVEMAIFTLPVQRHSG
jgi:hypothetical protein